MCITESLCCRVICQLYFNLKRYRQWLLMANKVACYYMSVNGNTQ